MRPSGSDSSGAAAADSTGASTLGWEILAPSAVRSMINWMISSLRARLDGLAPSAAAI